ncbi:MAG: hypothetical protein HYV90_01055 [Candidatus Woesebacteria bacterium]|nr:MAG: hypothetical protein HYV90_01055 [Candidatus Woesebacteria bacterium]
MPLNLNGVQTLAGIPLEQFGITSMGTLISKILPFVFGAAGIALLIYLVMGGFQMMTSRGDPKAMQGAQGKITNALLGFVIIAVAYLFVKIIGQVFGITAFSGIFI